METTELMKQLRDSAFKVILTHPGCSYEEWRASMLELYRQELVGAFGDSDESIDAGLDELWSTPYQPKGRNDSLSLFTWSLVLKDNEAVREYFAD